MRKWLPAIAVLCIGLAAVLYFLSNSRRQVTPVQTAPRIQTNTAHAPVLQAESAVVSQPTTKADSSPVLHTNARPAVVAVVEPADSPVVLPEPEMAEAELPKLPQSAVLENVRLAFRNYQSKFGGNPVGTNLEITRALNGENPRQTRFLRMEDGMRVNAKGELIDTWGTPYFFHQLSGTEMEIHCAGPDKKMWTADDLVIK